MGKAAFLGSDWAILTSDNPRSEDPLEIIREIEQGMARENGGRGAEPPHDSGHGYSIIPDRHSAIESAVRMADVEDIILIAGKGHEDYQIQGEKKIHFDDREVARESLARLFGERRSG